MVKCLQALCSCDIPIHNYQVKLPVDITRAVLTIT